MTESAMVDIPDPIDQSLGRFALYVLGPVGVTLVASANVKLFSSEVDMVRDL